MENAIIGFIRDMFMYWLGFVVGYRIAKGLRIFPKITWKG